MANDTTVHARVNRRGYTYRGNSLAVGEIVRLTKAQFERTQSIRPPYLVRATEAQVKAARRIIDLAEIEAPKPANVEAAEKAAVEARPTSASNPAPKK